jgi:putative peptidoglycan lipid II flippase
MIRPLVTVSFGTLASRVLGFVRDSLIAALLGAGPVADAFLVAFQFINVARRLLTEGALNAALVPGYLRVREASGPTAAAAFAGRVLGSVTLVMILIAITLGLLMPYVVGVLAPGLASSSTIGLAATNARLMLPYFAFVGPATVMMGVLNAEHRVALTALSPVLFNLTMIATIGGLLWLHADPRVAALTIATAVGLAGCLQLMVLIRRERNKTWAVTPLRITFDREIRGFFRKAIPGMIANSGPQLLLVGGAIVASSSPAAVSWLYFANRLIEFPLGLVGVAMGAVLVPRLTRAVHDDDRAALRYAESRSLEVGIGLALPATIGLILLSPIVVRVLFEHGAFTARDTAATASALSWLAIGLFGHVLFKVLAPAFFARDDTMTPLLATLAAIATAVIAAMALDASFGPIGVAIAISCGAWFGALILLWRGATTFGFSFDADARRRMPRIVLSAIIMGLALRAGAIWLVPLATNGTTLTAALILFLLIALALAVYCTLLRLFGALDIKATALSR